MRVHVVARFFCLIFFLFATAGTTFADDYYKTLDSKGRASFSDKPVSSASKKITVETQPINTEDAERLTREQSQSAEYDRRVKNSYASQAEDQERVDAQRRQRCAQAQSRYQLFADGGAIYRRDESGQRVFYSSQEIEQKRVELRADVESLCGG